MAFDPDSMILSRQIDENAQLAYIEVSDKDYVTNLYVEFNFSDYTKDKMLWIVPFEDYPQHISLDESSYSDFKERFNAIDDRIKAAKNLQKAYERFPSDYGGTMVLAYGGPIFGVFFIEVAWATTAGIAGGYGEFQPVAWYLFPGIGSAAVYQFSEGANLREFFSAKGVTPPAEIETYLDKYIVAFTLDKKPTPLGIAVRFRFDNDGSIYYPSGTTQYFKEAPESYEIRIIAPRGYSLEPNMPPLLKESDESYQYYVYGAVNERDIYYFSRARLSSLINNTDLHIDLIPSSENKAPLGLWMIKYIGPLPITLLSIVASWLLGILLVNKFRAKGWNLKDVLEIAIIGMFFSFVISIFSLFIIKAIFNTENRTKSNSKSLINSAESAMIVFSAVLIGVLLYVAIISLFSVKI